MEALIPTTLIVIFRAFIGTIAFSFLLSLLAFSTALTLRQTMGLYDVKEPPMLPYWIPFVGHAMSFKKDPAGFVRQCQQKVGLSFRSFSSWWTNQDSSTVISSQSRCLGPKSQCVLAALVDVSSSEQVLPKPALK